MFFSGNDKLKKNHDFNIIRDQADKLKMAQEEIKGLRSQVEAYRAVTAAAPVAINWKVLNAFSVERLATATSAKTVIGYFIQTPNEEGKLVTVVKEWSLYISEERHAQLVDEFKQTLQQK